MLFRARDELQVLPRNVRSLPLPASGARASLYALRTIYGSHASSPPCSDFCRALLETYAVSDRINLLILEQLDRHARRAAAPNARTITAIFAPTLTVRRK